MRYILSTGCFLTAFLAFTPVRAEVTASEFISKYDKANPADRQLIEAFLAATYNGMEWANSAATHDKHPLYCPPQKVVLIGPQLLDMLRREAAAKPYVADKPAGLALLMALEIDFPCP